MKKIYFGANGTKRGVPFWQPWGILKYLSKVLMFLLLLLLFLFLLSMFKSCSNRGINRSREVISNPNPDWKKPIPGGDKVGLPSPDKNVLPPFEEMEPVPNPDNGGATEIYPNLLYVIFDSDADDQTFIHFAEKFTAIYPSPHHEILYYNVGAKTAVLKVPEEKRSEICNNLNNQISDIGFFVIPVEVMTQYSIPLPDDPAFNDTDKSWYFDVIQMTEAWNITQGSSEVIVGIVDSFMDLNHPELKGDRCIYPYSIVKGNEDVRPGKNVNPSVAGHGTLVTGIAVGNMNNSKGSAGIAPKCKFIPVSLGESINTITEVEGLLYCMYHGASVINLSCGVVFSDEINLLPIEKQIEFSEKYGKEQEKMWNYVFELAKKRNVAIVWAAGNTNCYNAMDASKRNANTIRVAAIDKDLNKADFSNFGNFKNKNIYESTISAPGVDIWGPIPNNSYDSWSGTSFSAPIITGVVALIKSQNKDLTTNQIIKILQSTGKPVSNSNEIGNIVQVKDALIKAKQTVSSASTDNL